MALHPLRKLARVRLGCATICSFYGFDLMELLPDRRTAAIQRLLDEETAFIVEGEHMAQRLVDAGCSPAKVHVNRLGIDLELFPSRQPGNLGRPVRCLTVGRFVEKKGIPDAIRAVAAARHGGADVKLTVVGDGYLRDEISNLIAREAAGEFVRLAGNVDYATLRSLYYSHDVLLQPSVTASNGDTEGGVPVSIVEGMAAGLPVIATRHADIPNTVVEGENALLAPERRPDLLSEALIEVARDPSLWERLSAAGRVHASRRFDCRKQSIDLESIYDRILGGS
jgi:colanic acid/amylovoran biosynthesis glycosyltransferase